MDKFGIFNLLSALTALRGEREDAPAPPQTAPQKTQPEQEAEMRKQRASTFLERHAAISRRIDRKNR